MNNLTLYEEKTLKDPSHVVSNTYGPQANYPCGNLSVTSSEIRNKSYLIVHVYGCLTGLNSVGVVHSFVHSSRVQIHVSEL